MDIDGHSTRNCGEPWSELAAWLKGCTRTPCLNKTLLCGFLGERAIAEHALRDHEDLSTVCVIHGAHCVGFTGSKAGSR